MLGQPQGQTASVANAADEVRAQPDAGLVQAQSEPVPPFEQVESPREAGAHPWEVQQRQGRRGALFRPNKPTAPGAKTLPDGKAWPQFSG